MRIALLHPLYWPEARRGSERVVHDLGMALARCGHDVTLLTTHPMATTNAVEDGMRIVRDRRPPRAPGLGLHELFIETAPVAALRLLRHRFDLAHAFFPASALAAVEARRLGGPPVVFSFHGIPTRTYLVARRYRLELLLRAVRSAAAVTVLSEAAAEPFRRYLRRDPEVLPAGVLAKRFAGRDSNAGVPTLLCVSSFADPRKRIPLLLAAFERVRESRPETRLLLEGRRDAIIHGEPPALPEGAEWLGLEDDDALARAYGEATVTVLPSVQEAQGLVLIESMAAGTPVVAARSGACPEIVSDAEVGLLFEPDDEKSLAATMISALALGSRPAAATACRRRAADFDWSRLLEAHLDLYERVAAGGR